jgi:hypothetical protein
MEWYRSGEDAYLSRDEIAEQSKRNLKCEKTDPIEDWLRNRYEPSGTGFICTEYLLAKMQDQRLITVIDRVASMRLSDACKRLRFERKIGGGSRRLKGYGLREIVTVSNPQMHANRSED